MIKKFKENPQYLTDFYSRADELKQKYNITRLTAECFLSNNAGYGDLICKDCGAQANCQKICDFEARQALAEIVKIYNDGYMQVGDNVLVEDIKKVLAKGGWFNAIN